LERDTNRHMHHRGDSGNLLILQVLPLDAK